METVIFFRIEPINVDKTDIFDILTCVPISKGERNNLCLSNYTLQWKTNGNMLKNV